MARAGGGAVGPGLQESARGQEVARSSFRRAFPERLLCAPRWGWGAAGPQRVRVPDLCKFVPLSGCLSVWGWGN